MLYSIDDMNPARNKYAIGTIILLAGISIHFRLAGLQAPIRKPTSLDHPDATAIIKLEFGLKHPEPRTWNGSAAASTGEILNTWGWHFSSPDRIDGTAAWQFEAREYNLSGQRYRTGFDLPGGVKVLPNGVYIALNAPDSAEIAIRGNHGDFSFRLSDLKSNGSMPFLGGDVRAVFTPPTRARTLSRGFRAADYSTAPLVSFHADRQLHRWAPSSHRVSAPKRRTEKCRLDFTFCLQGGNGGGVVNVVH